MDGESDFKTKFNTFCSVLLENFLKNGKRNEIMTLEDERKLLKYLLSQETSQCPEDLSTWLQLYVFCVVSNEEQIKYELHIWEEEQKQVISIENYYLILSALYAQYGRITLDSFQKKVKELYALIPEEVVKYFFNHCSDRKDAVKSNLYLQQNPENKENNIYGCRIITYDYVKKKILKRKTVTEIFNKSNGNLIRSNSQEDDLKEEFVYCVQKSEKLIDITNNQRTEISSTNFTSSQPLEVKFLNQSVLAYFPPDEMQNHDHLVILSDLIYNDKGISPEKSQSIQMEFVVPQKSLDKSAMDMFLNLDNFLNENENAANMSPVRKRPKKPGKKSVTKSTKSLIQPPGYLSIVTDPKTKGAVLKCIPAKEGDEAIVKDQCFSRLYASAQTANISTTSNNKTLNAEKTLNTDESVGQAMEAAAAADDDEEHNDGEFGDITEVDDDDENGINNESDLASGKAAKVKSKAKVTDDGGEVLSEEIKEVTSVESVLSENSAVCNNSSSEVERQRSVDDKMIKLSASSQVAEPINSHSQSSHDTDTESQFLSSSGLTIQRSNVENDKSNSAQNDEVTSLPPLSESTVSEEKKVGLDKNLEIKLELQESRSMRSARLKDRRTVISRDRVIRKSARPKNSRPFIQMCNDESDSENDEPKGDLMKKLKCKYCSRTFKSKSGLFYHENTHEGNEEFNCEHCDAKFSNKSCLRQHVRRIHLKACRSEFPCENCDRVFTSWSGLDYHKANVHSQKSVICELCGKNLPNKHRYDKHKLSKHSKNDNISRQKVKPIKQECNDCGKVFKSISGLAYHKSTQHSDSEVLICGVCGAQLKSYKTLKSHMKTHEDKSHLSCEICGKQYLSEKSLQGHMNIHKQKFPYPCHHCEKSFPSVTYRLQHIKTHHRTSDKIYKCDLCEKNFKSLKNFKYHVLTHTGEKPYICKECGKCFRASGTLAIHKRTHSGLKNHICDFCGHGFVQKSNMTRHIKNNHSHELNERLG